MENLRQIRQGGMGIYIGTPFLAKSVALNGGYGTVSGALADQVFVRILQDGDPGGHGRRSLSHFPNQAIANMVIDRYFVPYGQTKRMKQAPPMTLRPTRESIALVVCATYSLVWLAKEGHNNPIAINFMEKIQMPLIYGFVGAMLAGVDCITMGAGIPTQVPGILDAIARGENPRYRVDVKNCEHKTITIDFDLKNFFGKEIPQMKRPDFIPIVASSNLARVLLAKSTGSIEGFVVENYTAGGHNAPPKGNLTLDEEGEPIYGPRDIPNLQEMKVLGLPFWVGGGYASKESLDEAMREGAAGVQLGSIFALCNESGMRNDVRTQAISQLYYGETSAYTDPKASPTSYPFKTVNVEDTMADSFCIESRNRCCDLGGLLHPCQLQNGDIIYRCSAEPRDKYFAKGGFIVDTHGAYCLCNGLLDNSVLHDGGGAAIVTLGTNTQFLNSIINSTGNFNYSVKDIMKYMGLA